LLRSAPYAALALLGFSIVIVAGSVHPGPRVSGRGRLIDLIAREDERSRSLRRQLDALQADIDRAEAVAARRQDGLAEVRARAARLEALAGLAAVSGSGVTVELRDSTLREARTSDPNDLVIHEQDLQAVVNALWAAGAEAMAINGERIISASAVRCVGNVLLLHGSAYAPPYRIQAIGEQRRLLDRLRRDPLVERFRIFAEDFQLGFDMDAAGRLTLPPFRGIVSANVARVA
jgi:uncharacterized protein YlxW (UPF0749 family)